MTLVAEKIKKEALTLSASERASIAHELILSLDEPSDLCLDQKSENEIRRRVQMIKEGTAIGQPADQVFAEIEDKFRESCNDSK